MGGPARGNRGAASPCRALICRFCCCRFDPNDIIEVGELGASRPVTVAAGCIGGGGAAGATGGTGVAETIRGARGSQCTERNGESVAAARAGRGDAACGRPGSLLTPSRPAAGVCARHRRRGGRCQFPGTQDWSPRPVPQEGAPALRGQAVQGVQRSSLSLLQWLELWQKQRQRCSINPRPVSCSRQMKP